MDRPETSPTAPVTGVSHRVTCVVVTHNAGAAIRDCLSSLPTAAAAIVVDNASSDNTIETVRDEFPNVELVETGQNLGYGGAVNLVMGRLESPYVAVVNQDVIGVEGWIDRLVEALEQHLDAAVATPRILLADDPSRLNTCGNDVHYTGITPCRGYGEPASAYGALEDVSAISGAAFVVRRAMFEAVGGFDASFFLYLEDTDLSLRVALAGYRCLYVADSVALHAFAPRFSAAKLHFLERNRHALLLKTYRWRTLFVLGPALLLVELAVWAYAVMRGPEAIRSKAKAYLWIGRHRRQILLARRRAQAVRRISDRDLFGRLTTELQLGELGAAGKAASMITAPLFRGWHRVANELITW